MLKFAHIVMIPMTGVGVRRGFKNEAWFRNRLEIFKKYTLQSLLNQSQRAFLLWLTFRPQEQGHPLIKELETYLKEKKIGYAITYHGLMYWDDKFNKDPKSMVTNIARVLRQCWREKDFWPMIPATFEILFSRKNQTLIYRLEKALYELTFLRELLDANYIYVTRIDSDDMFHKEAMAEIQRVMPFTGALIYQNGYVYNESTNELAEWNPKTNPPFHTVIFLGSHFFNPTEYLNFYKNFKSHEDIPKVFTCKQLENGRYCVVVHGNHISTIFNHPFKGKAVDPKLLKDFV